MACLASSGGPKTLRVTLKAGLGPLLKSVMGGDENNNNVVATTTTTAVYGIGAFFSSCRIAMEKITANGIQIHPHPLCLYSANAVDKICRLSETNTTTTTTTDQPSAADDVRVAAVRAMESILLASPANLFEAHQIEEISRFLLSLSTLLLVEGNQETINAEGENTTTGNDDSELLQASSQTMGAILGRTLNAADDDDDEIMTDDENKKTSSALTVIETQQLKAFLRNDVFATLIASVKIPSRDASSTTTVPGPRLDRKTLATASSFGAQAAHRIVQPLAETLHKALLEGSDETARATAETLSFLFLKVITTLQELTKSSCVLRDRSRYTGCTRACC